MTQKKVTTLITIITLLLLGAIIPWQQYVHSEGANNNSSQWEEPVHISTNAPGAFLPTLQAAPNNDLMVVYNHRQDAGVNINNPYFSRLNAGSTQWTTPAPIYVSSDNIRQVNFAFDNNNLAHAVWRTVDESVQYIVQTGPTQWPAQPQTVTTAAGGQTILDLDIVIDSNNIPHIVWGEGPDSSRQIYHAYRTGGSWTITNVSATAPTLTSSPSVAVDAARNAHVVWYETSFEGGFVYRIKYKKGTWTGSSYTWDSNATTLSGALTTARRPTIVSKENTLHVAFTRRDSSTEQYAYYTRFVPGSGWGTPIDTSDGNAVGVNTNSPFFLTNSLATCNNDVALHYHGTLTATGNEIIWSTRNDANQVWSPKTQLTEANLRTINPSATCIGGNLHLVYEVVNQINENHQIYYIRQNNTLFLPFVTRQ